MSRRPAELTTPELEALWAVVDELSEAHGAAVARELAQRRWLADEAQTNPAYAAALAARAAERGDQT